MKRRRFYYRPYVWILCLLCLVAGRYVWKWFYVSKDANSLRSGMEHSSSQVEDLVPPPVPCGNLDAPAARGRAPKEEIPISDDELSAESQKSVQTNQRSASQQEKPGRSSRPVQRS